MFIDLIENKIFIALLGAIAGWFLAQGTTVTKYVWTRYQLRRGLLEELKDVRAELKRVGMAAHRSLQISAHGGIEPSVPLALPTYFFKHCYKDVFPSLNSDQRISYQLIHAEIDGLNKIISDLTEFIAMIVKVVHEHGKDEFPDHHVLVWRDRMSGLLTTVRTIEWHIDRHVTNHRHPKIDYYGPIHASYIERQKEIAKEIESILENAKRLDPKDF